MQMIWYLVQFLIMMTYICANLVSVAHANHFIRLHRTRFCVFLDLHLKTTILDSLKIMKKSPITEYSDHSKPFDFSRYLVDISDFGNIYIKNLDFHVMLSISKCHLN